MATFIKRIKCGDKTYNISYSGKDVYFSSSSRTGGSQLKGVRIYNNELRLNSTNKPISDVDLCARIKECSKSGCYVTTAICSTLNKPDDCEELTLLRMFRDKYMLTDPEVSRLVYRYYDTAPGIVERMKQKGDYELICARLYRDYINPCVALIREGHFEKTLKLYQDMVAELEQTYS